MLRKHFCSEKCFIGQSLRFKIYFKEQLNRILMNWKEIMKAKKLNTSKKLKRKHQRNIIKAYFRTAKYFSVILYQRPYYCDIILYKSMISLCPKFRTV